MTQTLHERLVRERTPLIEPEGVLFVWEGDTPPRVMGDFNGWDPEEAWEMEPAGDELWILAVELPDDAYIEYVFLEGKERILDPHNPRRTPNGMGKINQYFYMPAGKPEKSASGVQPASAGELIVSELPCERFIAGKTRRVTFYRPAVEGPVPLLLVYDGNDYLRRAKLPRILDRLIAAGQIPALAAAFVPNGGWARGMEYACSESTLAWLETVLLPAAEETLDLLPADGPVGPYGVLGASFSGLMALYTGVRMPGVFGKVYSQSGAFTIQGHAFPVWELLRLDPVPKLRVVMDVGRFEWLLENNREMNLFLRERGVDVTYHEYNAGHNYPAWRNQLGRGLAALWGG